MQVKYYANKSRFHEPVISGCEVVKEKIESHKKDTIKLGVIKNEKLDFFFCFLAIIASNLRWKCCVINLSCDIRACEK